MPHVSKFNYNAFGSRGRTHGTISCYQWEVANKIPTCDECRRVSREKRARDRAARRARLRRVT